MLNWTELKGDQALNGFRTPVPGGWFVVIEGQAEEAHGSGFFYPDPDHSWDGTSLDLTPPKDEIDKDLPFIRFQFHEPNGDPDIFLGFNGGPGDPFARATGSVGSRYEYNFRKGTHFYEIGGTSPIKVTEIPHDLFDPYLKKMREGGLQELTLSFSLAVDFALYPLCRGIITNLQATSNAVQWVRKLWKTGLMEQDFREAVEYSLRDAGLPTVVLR